ncbi:alcohol dehydrogenase, partial [candidate division WOR-3 bacterium]|nr:alcohol dehydrogenase [candidate division WOR-3 bacterium]
MLALQIERPAPAETGPLRPVELPLPEPGPGEVRVRVEACGVCRTDLHEVEGDIRLPRLPLVPGHEVVGVIDTLGPGVDSPAAGTRVGIPWLASTCGRCRFCQSGRENLCDDIRFTGFHVDGGYAEYALARAGFAYPLPAGLDPVAAAPLLCAGVIGLRALRLALPRRPSTGPAPGSCRLGLYGFGASAYLCLQV